jgi:hypothetical protein
MKDVLDSGADPRGSRSRRGVAVGVAAVVLVAGGIVAARAGRSQQPRAAASPSASATSEPSPSPSESSASSDEYVVAGPRRIEAERWSGPHDPLLVVGGGELQRIAPLGEARTVGPVSPGRAAMIPVTGGTVVFVPPGGPGNPPSEARFVPAGDVAPRSLGTAGAVAAAADPRTVWLVDASTPQPGNGVAARRVDAATGRVRQRVTLPPDMRLVAEVATGLVLTGAAETDLGNDAVWSPGTRRYVRRLSGSVVGATPRAVLVVRAGCYDDCTDVVDVVTGAARTARGVDATGLASPTMSPDGRWVAVYTESPDHAQRLAVHDTTTGTTATIEDSALITYAITFGVWSRDSRTLYVTTALDDGAGEVVAWRSGTNAVRTLLDRAPVALMPE